jgi:hypothetical protein
MPSLTLLIIARQSGTSVPPVAPLVSAIAPYLGALGVRAGLSVRPYTETRDGEPHARRTLVELALEGVPPTDAPGVITRLTRFLRHTARDAELDVSFEFLLAEPVTAGEPK